MADRVPGGAQPGAAQDRAPAHARAVDHHGQSRCSSARCWSGCCCATTPRRNPSPSQHQPQHRAWKWRWTVIPVLILVVIAIPSFRLVYYEDRTTDADMTIKVTGHQWYWEYTYPDNGNVDFTSYIIKDEELKPGQQRLLDVDNPLVLPAGKNIRILTTQRRRDPQLLHPEPRRAALRDPRPRPSRPGCGSTSPGTTTANATRSAAPTTASCRSRSSR